MDVVKKNIEVLNGSVQLRTEAGQGTCFRIRLPLTLAILDGLLLRVGEEIYILPLTVIVESLQPNPDQLQTVLGQREVVIVRDAVLPLLRLHRLLDIPQHVSNPSQGIVVIVEHEQQCVAILVDEVIGQQQVVLKSLEANFQKLTGLAGATILGDGQVALILDVRGLMGLASTGERVQERSGVTQIIPPPPSTAPYRPMTKEQASFL